jgi:MFS family permease
MSVPHSKKNYLPWIICCLGAGYYFFETILEVIPSALVNDLMRSFSLGGATVGILDTAYFMTYAAMQIPGGYLLDRFHAQRILSLAILSCGLGLIFFGFSQHFSSALISRFLMGLGGSFGLMGALYLVATYLPSRYVATFMGLAIMIGLSGGLMQNPSVVAIQKFGWRSIIIFLGLIALLLATIFYCSSKKLQAKTHLQSPSWQAFCNIIKTPQNWWIALFGGLMYFPTGTLGSFWGINFLQAYYPKVPAAHLANINAMIFLGWIIGSPLVGWLSDLMQCRIPFLLIGSLGMLLVLFLITFQATLSTSIMFGLFISLGIFSGCSGLVYAMGNENNPSWSRGTIIGFINMFGALPTIIGSPLFGKILDHYWQGEFVHGSRLFSLQAYQKAMLLEIAVCLIAILIVCLTKETYSKN